MENLSPTMTVIVGIVGFVLVFGGLWIGCRMFDDWDGTGL